jgi:uncharacterized membrane protein
MLLLIIGLAMWSGLHFIPAIAISFRAQLIDQLGNTKYRLIFSVLVVASIVAMVFGWRSIEPVTIYTSPVWSAPVTSLFVLLAFILFSAAHSQSNIKRVIRHPQLTGLVIWSIGHLLSNGDNRSLILFGTLGLWAIAEMIMINKRDGDWVRPDPASIKSELLMLAKGAVMFGIFLFAHPYIAGVPAIVR